MFYRISERLEEITLKECGKKDYKYVAIVTEEEFQKNSAVFDMGIDLEMDVTASKIGATKAEVNYDSVTGSFSIPDRNNICGEDHEFAFALDEKGIVFINDDGTAEKIIRKIKNTKKWRSPSLERFIYDFLEAIVIEDLPYLENSEKKLDKIESDILAGIDENNTESLMDIRDEILDLKTHYEQLIDFGQELEENENNFFDPQNLRYFRLFTERVERLRDITNSLRDYTMQIRDLQHTQLEVKQNHIMTFLTVVTAIFMPLTLIVGWYGMNFKYMPELESPVAYPIIIGVCVLIIVISLIVFKKKKWL